MVETGIYYYEFIHDVICVPKPKEHYVFSDSDAWHFVPNTQGYVKLAPKELTGW